MHLTNDIKRKETVPNELLLATMNDTRFRLLFDTKNSISTLIITKVSKRSLFGGWLRLGWLSVTLLRLPTILAGRSFFRQVGSSWSHEILFVFVVVVPIDVVGVGSPDLEVLLLPEKSKHKLNLRCERGEIKQVFWFHL